MLFNVFIYDSGCIAPAVSILTASVVSSYSIRFNILIMELTTRVFSCRHVNTWSEKMSAIKEELLTDIVCVCVLLKPKLSFLPCKKLEMQNIMKGSK